MFQIWCYPNLAILEFWSPLFKKSTADHGLAKSYRPAIVSNTFLKLFELCMLEQCDNCRDMQFGFIRDRGTTMTVRFVGDVLNHCYKGISSFYV